MSNDFRLSGEVNNIKILTSKQRLGALCHYEEKTGHSESLHCKLALSYFNLHLVIWHPL